MKEKEMDKVIAFDTLFTNNRIQIYKILLSYLQPALQKKIAIYIKLMELQYTIAFFQNNPSAAWRGLPHEPLKNSGRLFDEVLPFCDTSQREKMNRMKDMIQNFENMQEMMETIQMMKELFPEGMGGGTGDNIGNGMDITQLLSMFGGADMSGLSGMSGIFDMFGSGFPPSGKDTPENS